MFLPRIVRNTWINMWRMQILVVPDKKKQKQKKKNVRSGEGKNIPVEWC